MLKKFLSILFLSYTILFTACTRETFNAPSNTVQIDVAYKWFQNYLKDQVFISFSNINYNWKFASTFTFKNGYTVITVPITEKNQNVAYQGKRTLYLYPWKNGKGFYAAIFELIPSEKHLIKNKGKFNIKEFSGIIATWDLQKGFSKGFMYEDGLVSAEIKIDFENPNKALTDKFQVQGLPMVTVVGKYPGPSLGSYYVTLMNDLGYSTSYLWNGLGANPCEYTGCSSDPSEYFDETQLNSIYQALDDMLWKDNLLDSTNNPCDSKTIAKLKDLSNNGLPELFRKIFGISSNINITFKSDNLGNKVGATTIPNYRSNDYTIVLNSYWQNQTTISLAATILHEMLHVQLMNWYLNAVKENNEATQKYLASEYNLFFDPLHVSLWPQLDFNRIMNQNEPGQHQIIAFDRIRDQMANALYSFAKQEDPNSAISMEYCNQMAWAGLSRTDAFLKLPESERTNILGILEAEKGASSSQEFTPLGKPCK